MCLFVAVVVISISSRSFHKKGAQPEQLTPSAVGNTCKMVLRNHPIKVMLVKQIHEYFQLIISCPGSG